MARRSLSSPKIVAQISATVTNTLDDAVAVSGAVSGVINNTLTSGIGASKASRGWQWMNTTTTPRTIAAAGTVVIDLYDFAGFDFGAGAGNDASGQALTLNDVVAILIKNENEVGDAGTLDVEPDAAQGWTPIGIHTKALLGVCVAVGSCLSTNRTPLDSSLWTPRPIASS